MALAVVLQGKPAATLAKLAIDDRPAVRCAALSALHAVPGDESAKLLLAALDDLQPSVREIAARRLGAYTSLRPTDALVAGLTRRLAHDTSAVVRQQALNSLASYGPGCPNILPALLSAMDDPASDVRAQAVTMLGNFGPAAAVATPALLRALQNEESEEQRMQLLTTLGEIGPGAQAAIPALQKLLADRQENTRTIAARSILRTRRRVTSEMVEPLLAAIRNDTLDPISVYYLVCASNRPDPTCWPLLVALAKSESNGRSAIQAAKAMGRLCQTQQMSLDPKHNFSPQILGYMGGAAIPLLCDMLGGDQDDEVLEALGRIGVCNEEAVKLLCGALSHTNSRIRQSAALQLSRIGPGARSAVFCLCASLVDEDECVLEAVVEALGQIDPTFVE
jgi:HEAT repeat protein